MLHTNADPTPTPPQNRENRRLKIFGIILMCVGLPVVGWLFDEGWRRAFFIPLYLVSANIAVLGLIFFMAARRDMSLLTNDKARKGALVKLAGANLLIVVMGFIALEESGKFGKDWKESWLGLLFLVVFLFMCRMGVGIFRRGWKYDALSADKATKEDTRPPVVYIRSFKEDDKLIPAKGLARWSSYLKWTIAISAEQELAFIMKRVGPVVAIGKPGEELPELGAARLYVGDDTWRDKITELMKQARLVVIRAGATANLQWEIDQAVKLLPLRQLILVSFQQDEGAEAFDGEVEQRFGKPETVNLPVGILLKLLSPFKRGRINMGKIIYFDENSKPHAEDMRVVLSWRGFVLSPYRPYWEALVAAFRRVFTQLDLPWVDRKYKSIAVLLALPLPLGMFGVHHFYLGNRRRGLFYLAFFWTFVSLVLALIDTIKFMLANQQDFEQKFVPHPHPAEGLKEWNKERSVISQ